MRNRALHDALRDFALEAAATLVRATEGGAEIGYALDERTDGGTTLYRYRPLTAEFIGERWVDLRFLPAFEGAARALGTGARAYLRRRGEPGADAEPALRAMLERLYEDSTSFAFPEERFERVYAGVEHALYAGTVRATVAAPVLGLVLEGARVELEDDLALADVALLPQVPAGAWVDPEAGESEGSPASTFVVLERDIPADATLPLDEARRRFRSTLTALRLLDRGGVALAPVAYAQVGEGGWRPLRLDSTGRARGEPRSLPSEHGHELRGLLEALDPPPRPGALAWALGRFEMGLERASEVDALSDYLLALRALLDATRGAEPGTVALRLAALCAEEGDRRAVQRRIESAFALEPFVIEGGLGAARGERYVEEVGRHGPHGLVRELEEALRHLLAGVLGGELASDLAGLADEVLLRTGEPVEIRAGRMWSEDDEDFADGEPRDGADDVGESREEEPAVVRGYARKPAGRRTLDEAATDGAEAEELWDAAPAPELDEEFESYSAPV